MTDAHVQKMPALLTIRGLKKSFGTTLVLNGVDLDVHKGEVVTILGPSGSGKTTLLRCVNFLESYDEGSIKISDQEVGYYDSINRKRRKEVDLAKIRSEAGMVFQMFNLFPHLTAIENVMLGLVKVRNKAKDEAYSLAKYWLERVGLGNKINNLPSELSGGQQQRVGIARAVAMEPQILLLDEITSALDPELVEEVLDVVLALARDGMTMLVVTHELAFAQDVSTRTVFMDKGVVAYEGSPDSLFSKSFENERLKTFLRRFEKKH
jgi:polar amino acid transport system ATP-binding protein